MNVENLGTASPIVPATSNHHNRALPSHARPFLADPQPEHTHQPVHPPLSQPPFQQTDPDFDPQFNPVIDEPMSPNTAAIWMALIQFTEPSVPLPQTLEYTTEQAVLGMNEQAAPGYATGGYGTESALGQGMRAPLSTGSAPRPLTSQVRSNSTYGDFMI